MSEAVVIVGAGSAGLAAATALRRRGIDAIVLERGPSVATSWRARHDRLRLNTVRQTSGLPGFRIPRGAGRWVARDAYVAYLREFAAAERIDVRFRVDVVRIDLVRMDQVRIDQVRVDQVRVDQVRVGRVRVDLDAGGWQVHTATDTIPAAHVIVATGHDRVPWTPTWQGADDFMPS